MQFINQKQNRIAPIESVLNRIVCEVPFGKYDGAYKWFEVQIKELPSAVSENLGNANIISATDSKNEAESLAHIEKAIQHGFKHILFEAISEPQTKKSLSLIKEAGAVSIVTYHSFNSDMTSDEISEKLMEMEFHGADIVKVAYLAKETYQVAAGLIALDKTLRQCKVPVSVTPMGTKWGRVAAACAGSALVFAPLEGTEERHSAAELLRIVMEIMEMETNG